MNWIEKYTKLLSNEYYPEIYNHFIAATLLSSVINRNCWLDFGFYNIYPTVYSILIEYKNGENLFAIVRGIELLKSTTIPLPMYNTDMIVENIVSYMYNTRVSCNYNNLVFYKTPCLLYNFNMDDMGFKLPHIEGLFSFINMLYSAQDEYRHYDQTKREETILTGPFLSLLYGCSIQFYDKILSQELVAYKYLRSNILFIHYNSDSDSDSDSDNNNNTDNNTDNNRHQQLMPIKEIKQLKQEVIHDLINISNLYGALSIKEEARRKLIDIRNTNDYKYKNLLTRLTIIYSISRSMDGIVEIEDIDMAYKMINVAQSTKKEFKKLELKEMELKRAKLEEAKLKRARLKEAELKKKEK